MNKLFGEAKRVGIRQVREIWEIAVGWETANKYEIIDEDGKVIGFAAEKSSGIFDSLLKNILKTKRPIVLDIWDKDKKLVLAAKRPFYFFFSDMRARGASGELIGDVRTRFGVVKRKYDLIDSFGKVFARIESPRWKLWTFYVKDQTGADAGAISKKWGGFLKEAFSDSDQFALDLSKREWTDEQKALLLCAGMIIDLDFFENNSSSAGGLFD